LFHIVSIFFKFQIFTNVEQYVRQVALIDSYPIVWAFMVIELEVIIKLTEIPIMDLSRAKVNYLENLGV
jgi:hypothetical protein